jgi:hypothetical protein
MTSHPTPFSSKRVDVPEMDYINLMMFRENTVGGLSKYEIRVDGFSTRSEIAREWLRLRTECRKARETK